MKITSFTKKVYKAVIAIPIGEVRTYEWVARKIGSPKAYRAVGQVLKNNPWPLIIPCHRVVASSGELGGYSGPGGTVTKSKLLALEKEIRRCLENKE